MNIKETFETTPLNLTFTGDWELTNINPQTGTYCFGSKSGLVDGGTSTAETTYTVDAGITNAKISFWYRVSSEQNWDMLHFYIDNAEKNINNNSGTVNWTYLEFPLTAGTTHKLKWTYVKDSSGGAGEDRAYIDSIFLGVICTDYGRADITRNISDADTGTADIIRKVAVVEFGKADTNRQIYAQFINSINLWGLSEITKVDDTAIESIQIGLDAGQLSEKYTATLRSGIEIGNNFNCIVGDFNCSFTVNDIKSNTDTCNITARQDLNEWMYQSCAFSFSPASAHLANAYVNQAVNIYTTMPYASTIMQYLGVQGSYDDFTATTIGLQANKYLSGNELIDVTPTKNTNTDKYKDGGQDVRLWGMTDYKTKKQLLTSLFSWSSSLPRLKHIITFRNGIPHVYQRNKLPIVSNLDDATRWVTDLKEEDKELIKTLYGNSQYSNVKNKISDSDSGIQDAGDLFDGTITFGNAKLVYNSGMLTTKVENGKTTNYSYKCIGTQYEDDSQGTTELNVIFGHTNIVLSQEETDDKIVCYYYDTYNKINYLSRKVEYNPQDGDVTVTATDVIFASKKFDVTVTNYVPMQNGFWGYTVKSYDGKAWATQSSGIMESPAGGQASLYRAKTDFKSKSNKEKEDVSIQLEGQPLGDIPVAPDYKTACLIANEINWMNNKTHRTIIVEVFNLPNNNHLIDVIEKVIYNEVEWYVVSNNVAVQTNRVSQTLTLERWE